MPRTPAALAAARWTVACLVAAASVPAAPLEQDPAFLGFQEGEERRYVLGPPDALYAGESGTWSIRLRDLAGEPRDGIFVLAHEWQRGERRTETAPGSLVQVESDGELRVNAHGFPLDLTFTTRRHLAGLGEWVYSIHYRYADRTYLKQISAEGKSWSHTAMIHGHRHLDGDLPGGLYAFLPTVLDCSTQPRLSPYRAARVRPPRRSPGAAASPTGPSSPLTYASDRYCEEALFANPGLISLMMPALWEEGTGELDLRLLTPTGPTGGSGLMVGGQVGGVATVSSPRGDGGGMAPDANTIVERLHYRERVSVEVGSRQREAWLFDFMNIYEAVYVDDDNVVLRVDVSELGRQFTLAGSAVSVDPTQLRNRQLHIRLLFPSEY